MDSQIDKKSIPKPETNKMILRSELCYVFRDQDLMERVRGNGYVGLNYLSNRIAHL